MHIQPLATQGGGVWLVNFKIKELIVKSYEAGKGQVETLPLSLTVPIVNPRLMRLVPSNVVRVIGNFDEAASYPQSCANLE